MPLGPVNILLVADDESDFVLVRDLLREIPTARFTIDWVPDFDAGLETFCRAAHDVCLVDDNVGHRTGVEFIRAANDRGVEAPVILLTDKGEWDVDLAAMDAGAADYVTRFQLTPALLERAIRYSIQQKRSEKARLKLLREQAARREAEAANRAKDEFIAVVSHELRTPLNAIMGWVQLLRMGDMDEETRNQAIDTIDRSAKTQSRLIEDLLDVSRIQSGKVRLEKTPVKLSLVVSCAVDGVRPTAEQRTLSLEARLDDVGVVIGDATRLQQVASNLLTNAVKFTPDGGRVTVELRCDGAQARLVVSDTGQGIEPEFLPFVFDRFQQGHAEVSTPRQQGLGLGLAIVRQLAELHGGTVHAHSDGAGKGATFTVTLPLAQGDVEPAQTENAPLHAADPVPAA